MFFKPTLRQILSGIAADIKQLLQKVNAIMSAEDDLKAAVANLATAVNGGVAEIQTEAAAIAAAIAAQGTTDPAATTAAINEAVGNINALASKMNDAVAAASAPATPATGS